MYIGWYDKKKQFHYVNCYTYQHGSKTLSIYTPDYPPFTKKDGWHGTFYRGWITQRGLKQRYNVYVSNLRRPLKSFKQLNDAIEYLLKHGPNVNWYIEE